MKTVIKHKSTFMLPNLFYQRAAILIIMLALSFPAWSQMHQVWDKHYKPLAAASYTGHQVIVDNSGNLYTSGLRSTDSSVNGQTYIVETAFLAKYDNNGNLLWDKTLPSQSFVGTIKLDPQGNLVVAGIYYPSTFVNDFFVFKYDANGNIMWTSFWDGPLHQRETLGPVTLDAAGNIYAAISTQASSGTYDDDIALLKFNSSGTLLWQRIWDGPVHEDEDAWAISVPGDGYVYVGGNTAALGENPSDALVLKYSTAGNFTWAKTFDGGGNSYDGVMSLAVTAGGTVYATGSTNGGASSEDILTAKINTAGELVWLKTYHNESIDNGSFVALGTDNNIVVSGNSEQNGRTNFITIKYDDLGGIVWTRRFNSEDNCFSRLTHMKMVGNDVYVTGYTKRDNCSKIYYITQKYSSIGTTEWSKLYAGGPYLSMPRSLTVDAKGRVYVTGVTSSLSSDATSSGFASMTTVKYAKCLINVPQNIVVSNTTGQCGAIVNYPAATVTGDCGSLSYSQASGSFFPVGVTTVTVTSASSGESASFTVTVNDTEAPVISCPPALTVSCAADIPSINLQAVTAQDNCSSVVISHVADVISNQTCANRFTVTRTYRATDASGNSADCSQVITVNDQTPPQISGFTLSQYALWPANHTMRDIVLDYTVSDNCVSQPQVTVSVSSNEAVNGTGDGNTTPDWEIIDNRHIRLRAERSAAGEGRIYTVTVTVTDGCNAPVSTTKTVFVAHNINGPKTGMPFKVGSTVSFNGTFWDKPGNTHTAKWLLDGSAAAGGTVIEPGATQKGKVNGSYKFNSPGVYKLQMNITDASGATSTTNTNNELDALVVIYDPNGGYAYGGGWFHSPAGALNGSPSLSGEASFGFAVNYANPAKPKGETQFEFKSGNFEFNALNFDYLVVNGAQAQFKGTGKINGQQSGIGFLMTVTDGAGDGTGVDKIRLKIYNRNTGYIYYDNQPGVSDAAMPTTSVGTNSEIFIKGAVTIASRGASVEEDAKPVQKTVSLSVTASPNPAEIFTIHIEGAGNSPMILQLLDGAGRVVSRKTLPANTVTTKLGDGLKPGFYVVKLQSGKETAEVKLIRL